MGLTQILQDCSAGSLASASPDTRVLLVACIRRMLRLLTCGTGRGALSLPPPPPQYETSSWALYYLIFAITLSSTV